MRVVPQTNRQTNAHCTVTSFVVAMARRLKMANISFLEGTNETLTICVEPQPLLMFGTALRSFSCFKLNSSSTGVRKGLPQIDSSTGLHACDCPCLGNAI